MHIREGKRLAIIGASYLQLPLVEKAKEMGLYTICFAWEEGAVCKGVANEYYPISIVEKEQILDVCMQKHIDGICTIASDVAAPTVAYVAEKMGLTANSYMVAMTANDKYMMREAFSNADILCPKYKKISEYTDVNTYNWQYPLIVKPVDRSGSMGVTKVEDITTLNDAVNIAIKCSFKHEAIVEEYIEGKEISVECISFQSEHYPITITDKVTTNAPYFVELEHHQPAKLSPAQYKKIYTITKQALTALGVAFGASHAEYKITSNGDVYIMEIGARMGGDFIGSHLVPLSTGYDFLKGGILVALGQFSAPVHTIHDCSGVYFICKENERLISIMNHIENYPQIVKHEWMNRNMLSVKCSGDRSGYFIYKDKQKWEI